MTANRNLVENRIDLCRALGGGWELEPPEQNQSAASATVDKDVLRFDG